MKRQVPLLTIGLIASLVIWQVYLGGWGGQPEGRVLIEYGARKLNAGFPQAPWRLFASLLLHANWAHLVSNVIVLAIWGPRLERLLGRLSTFGLLVIAGLWGNLLSDIYGPELLGMGISGAALGLVSCTLLLAALTPQAEGWEDQSRNWLILSGVGLTLAVVAGLTAGSTANYRLDHWGHFGGAAYGAVVGLVAGKAKSKQGWGTAVVALVAGVAAGVVIWTRGSSPFG